MTGIKLSKDLAARLIDDLRKIDGITLDNFLLYLRSPEAAVAERLFEQHVQKKTGASFGELQKKFPGLRYDFRIGNYETNSVLCKFNLSPFEMPGEEIIRIGFHTVHGRANEIDANLLSINNDALLTREEPKDSYALFLDDVSKSPLVQSQGAAAVEKAEKLYKRVADIALVYAKLFKNP